MTYSSCFTPNLWGARCLSLEIHHDIAILNRYRDISRYIKKDLAYQTYCFLDPPQINVKLIMAKTIEMLSERYLTKDLADQLKTWFVDWSRDPPVACFWTPSDKY